MANPGEDQSIPWNPLTTPHYPVPLEGMGAPTAKDKAAARFNRLTPDEQERFRAGLYEAAQGTADKPADPYAQKLLSLLPSRDVPERTPERKQLMLRRPESFETAEGNPVTIVEPELPAEAVRLPGTVRKHIAAPALAAAEKLIKPAVDPLLSGDATNPETIKAAAGLALGGPAFAGARELGLLAPGLRNLATGGRVARSAFGAGTGAAAGASVSNILGGDPTTGALFGAGAGLVGAQGEAIRDPQTETGQIHADLARVGARPGLALIERPVVGGVLDTPEIRGLPHGDAGDLELALAASRGIGGNIETRLAGAKRTLGRHEDIARGLHGDEPQNTEEALATLEDVMRRNTANEEAISPALHREAQHYSRLLTNREEFPEIPPGETYEGFPTPGEPAVTRETPEISFDELLNVKKGLREATEPGQPGTLENAPARRLMGELKDLTAGVDPIYDAASARFGREMGELERVNDVLVGQDAPSYANSAARERAMANNLKSAGLNRADPRLAQLRQIAATEGNPVRGTPNAAINPDSPYSYIDTIIARNQGRPGGPLAPHLLPGMSPEWTIARSLREAGKFLDLRLLEPFSRLERAAEPYAGIPLEALQQREQK